MTKRSLDQEKIVTLASAFRVDVQSNDFPGGRNSAQRMKITSKHFENSELIFETMFRNLETAELGISVSCSEIETEYTFSKMDLTLWNKCFPRLRPPINKTKKRCTNTGARLVNRTCKEIIACIGPHTETFVEMDLDKNKSCGVQHVVNNNSVTFENESDERTDVIYHDYGENSISELQRQHKLNMKSQNVMSSDPSAASSFP